MFLGQLLSGMFLEKIGKPNNLKSSGSKINKGLKHFCHKRLRPLMSEGDEPYF
jgi:hypothetical protein